MTDGYVLDPVLEATGCIQYLAGMRFSIAEEGDPAVRRRIVETLTARLPQWFGRSDANRRYAEQAEHLEAWAARCDGREIGLLLLKRHGSASAEVYWLGVDPDHHRQGIGRHLIEAAEHRLRQAKARFLLVMTLHPDDPYEPYRRTRAFYEHMGFELALSAPGHVDASSDPLAYYLKLL
jgi:ribosomal protein S18 acetylase RimI-like enzyme